MNADVILSAFIRVHLPTSAVKYPYKSARNLSEAVLFQK